MSLHALAQHHHTQQPSVQPTRALLDQKPLQPAVTQQIDSCRQRHVGNGSLDLEFLEGVE